MAVERDIFGVSGPTYLNPVNWNCEHNRRSVAACLVQAVYVLERDRQLNRQAIEALAPPWWEFFHFDLIRKLVDDADMSIFGAIFEFNPPSKEASAENTPRFVIAFRGTITEKETVSRDLSLDLHLVQNGLHRTSRFTIAMQAVQNVASVFSGSTIWLAGHSLGAGLAILAGRNMVKKSVLLESFLFNPPFVAAPIERIRDERVKHGFRIARSVITAGLTIAMKGKTEGNNQRSIAEDSFNILSAWIPYLFVNPGDHICSEYIGYFQHRKNMEDLGAGFIEKLGPAPNVSRSCTWSSSFSSESSSSCRRLDHLPPVRLAGPLSAVAEVPSSSSLDQGTMSLPPSLGQDAAHCVLPNALARHSVARAPHRLLHDWPPPGLLPLPPWLLRRPSTAQAITEVELLPFLGLSHTVARHCRVSLPHVPLHGMLYSLATSIVGHCPGQI